MKLKVHSVVCCSNVADACGESKADAPTRAYMIIGGQLLGNSSPHLPSGCDELCASRSRRILKWRHDPANISTPPHHFPSRSASTKIGCGMISKSKSAGGWGTRSQAQHFFIFNFFVCFDACKHVCFVPHQSFRTSAGCFFYSNFSKKCLFFPHFALKGISFTCVSVFTLFFFFFYIYDDYVCLFPLFSLESFSHGCFKSKVKIPRGWFLF